MLDIQVVVAEPPALNIDGTILPLTVSPRQLERHLHPTSKQPRPMDGLTEWQFGSHCLFAVVGDRVDTFTINWRSYDIHDQEELCPETSNIVTDGGFGLHHNHDDLLALHGTPMHSRLDIYYVLAAQHLVTEYELFDGDGDVFYFRAWFRNDQATGIQVARASVFDT